MPVEIKGSCHCGAVKFSLLSSTPVPYILCVCSICRKVGGVGGTVGIGGHFDTFKLVEGKENVSVYKAILDRGTPEQRVASSERSFCKKCSSMLWFYDEQMPDLICPFASAIDSPELEAPETMTICCADSKPAYVRLPEGDKQIYQQFPPDSMEEWHKKHNVYKA